MSTDFPHTLWITFERLWAPVDNQASGPVSRKEFQSTGLLCDGLFPGINPLALTTRGTFRRPPVDHPVAPVDHIEFGDILRTPPITECHRSPRNSESWAVTAHR
ncbi:hypothetical protein ACVW19_003298 [Streptomyces sp. TE5632]